MKRKDLFVIVLGIVLLLGGWFTYFYLSKNSGPKSVVEITYLNRLYYREELTDDLVYDEVLKGIYGGENHIMIKDGKVWMESSNCPDQKCVHMGEIDKDSAFGIIICAPNGVSIRIINEENNLDG